MHKILVVSDSFGAARTKEELDALFQDNNCEAEYALSPDYTSLLDLELGKYDGMIVGSKTIPTELFVKATNLKAIIKYGAGTDNINKEIARKHNVKVLNLPGINADSVAEMTLGLLLAVARKIVAGDRVLREGKWERPLGVMVNRKTLGIIGVGNIGVMLAKIVTGLDMRILGYDLLQKEQFLELGGEYVDLEQLLRSSDFVSINVPLNKESYHMMGRNEFALMKKDAILINTSRGGVVDEQALYEALKNKEMAGAALDVFEKEPAINNPLFELDNIVCTPHIAAYTEKTLRMMDQVCIERLVQGFS